MIEQYTNVSTKNRNLRKAVGGLLVAGTVGLVGAEVVQENAAQKMEAANEVVDPTKTEVANYTLIVRPGTNLRADPNVPKIEGKTTDENVVEQVATPFAIVNPIVNADGWTYVPMKDGEAAWISPDAIGNIDNETGEKMVEVAYSESPYEFDTDSSFRVKEDGTATAQDVNGMEQPVAVRRDFSSNTDVENFVYGS